MAAKLTTLIADSHKSLSQIARETGLSLSHVSRINSGQRTPSPDVILKLSTVLDVRPEMVLMAVVALAAQEAA